VRLRTILIASITGLIILAGVAVFVVVQLTGVPNVLRGDNCEVRTKTGGFDLDPEQMANAATISAVGLRRGIPQQGIEVALAASLQESKLRNLTGGDRDSVGLFQQRPSQGWGDADQLQDPRYAAGKFYDALLAISGWTDLRVTEAAQQVQRSAYPEAYQKWADEAHMLASAFTGRETNAVACFLTRANVRGTAAATALATGLRLDWGQLHTSNMAGALSLTVTATNLQIGWQYAHWIVAHASGAGVEQVRIGDQLWSAESGAWESVTPDNGTIEANGTSAATTVIAHVYRP
jgi:hypothetical protein